jgi:hypothetical protein
MNHQHEPKSATKKDIDNYTQQVKNNEVLCNLPDCPKCKTSSKFFKRHELKDRKFKIIEDLIVYIVIGLLIRWKCPGCGKTFTQYPWFAVPYKRYTLPTIFDLCWQYLENELLSYRKLVEIWSPVEYKSDDIHLQHSTIYRWITTLGSYSVIIRESLRLILEAKPGSPIVRVLSNISVFSRKYKNKKRKKILINCKKIICLEKVYHAVFRVSIFSRLAAACHFS